MWTWCGYKLHLAVADGGVPVASCLSSASAHDSQAAIPLMQMAENRVAYLYDVADSAYDAGRIREYSLARGRVPVIARNGRGREVPPMGPGDEARYRERTSVERAFAWLKDRYGGRTVRVRGAPKVMCHLMFGVVALTAARLFALLG
jgi:transposase